MASCSLTANVGVGSTFLPTRVPGMPLVDSRGGIEELLATARLLVRAHVRVNPVGHGLNEPAFARAAKRALRQESHSHITAQIIVSHLWTADSLTCVFMSDSHMHMDIFSEAGRDVLPAC